MALDVGDAIAEGVSRGTARNALLLMVVVAAISLAAAAFSQTVIAVAREVLIELARQQGRDPPSPGAFGPTPLALPLSGPLAAVLFVAAAVANQAVVLVAIRTFVSDETATVPRAFLTRRIGWVTLNAVIGGLLVFALILLGLVLLVIPGLFVAVSLYFFEQEVAVNDSGLVRAMEDSWALARGDRLAIFVLGAVLVLAELAAALPAVALRALDAGAVAAVVGVVVSAAVTVVSVAIVSRAYVQLRAAEPEPEAAEGDDAVGALGPDEVEEAF